MEEGEEEEEEDVVAMRVVVGVVGEDWAWGCGIPLMGCTLVVLGVVVVGNGRYRSRYRL